MNQKVLQKLESDRPLAFFDIESTGTSPRADRIIEIAIVTVLPDGSSESYTRRVNPGIPIPPETTAIHGISDEDVADCPPFADIAKEIEAQLEGCDLAGYNVNRFDIPMLVEEFLRAGLSFDIAARRIVDAQTIFHKREPRDLTAALSFYCGEMHLDAHGAEADVMATIRVLEGQFEHYGDLPHDVAALDALCNPRDPSWADRTGRLRWVDGEIVINFGKKKGMSLRALIEKEPNYIKWLLRSDFPRDTIDLVQQAVEGTWPEPPEG